MVPDVVFEPIADRPGWIRLWVTTVARTKATTRGPFELEVKDGVPIFSNSTLQSVYADCWPEVRARIINKIHGHQAGPVQISALRIHPDRRVPEFVHDDARRAPERDAAEVVRRNRWSLPPTPSRS